MAVTLIINLLITLNLASNIVHYKFGTGFGQIFYDYSGFKNHGQNGESISSSTSDTIATTRGAYFSPLSECFIKLPPNEVNPTGITLGSIFSMVMWFKSKDSHDYNLIYRILDSSNYLKVVRIADNNFLRSQIQRGTYNSGDCDSSSNTLLKGMRKLDIWNYIGIINQGNTIKYYTTGLLVLTITQSSSYSESGSYSHFIGYNSSSFEGFVWSFYLYNETVSIDNFFSAGYLGSNCLVSPCIGICGPAIKENNVDYCISLDNSNICLLCSNGCIGSLCLDCNDCPSKSCELNSGIVKCYCIELTTATCSCGSSGYFLSSGIYCEKCYAECYSCTEALKCSTCKDPNAEIHSTLGCTCKKSFYNTTSLINSGVCLQCHSDCDTCSQSLKCSTCKATYSIIHSSVGCECMSGYYNKTSLIQDGSCLPCPSSCQTCKPSGQCESCKDINANPGAVFGCICKEGYFNSTSLETGGICEACHSNCKTCNESLKCLTCIDLNAKVDHEKGCFCNSGFFNVSELNFDGTCIECFDECKSCFSEFRCEECVDSHSYVVESGGCLCGLRYFNQTQVVSEGLCLPCHRECLDCNQRFLCTLCLDSNSQPSLVEGCDCKTGFFKDSSGSCQSCHQDCDSCTSSNTCSNCHDINAILISSQCECNPGYFNSSISSRLECSPCPENCSTCEDLKTCKSCSFQNMILINGICKCPENFFLIDEACELICPESTFILNNSCQDCPLLCLRCNSTCQECVENAEFYINDQCECKIGFNRSEKSCVEKFFDASFILMSFRIAVVRFSEPLKVGLGKNDFSFRIENRRDLEVILLKTKGKSEYEFSLNFRDAVENGTELGINITFEKVYSSEGSQLRNYRLKAFLPKYSPVTINPSVQLALNYTPAIVQAATSISIGAALTSNPSSAWILLNSIQLLSLLPLNSNNMTSSLRTFFFGFSGFNLLPNFLEYIFDSSSSSEPYLEARRYGIKSSVLFLNTGKSLSILIITLLIYPLVLCLSKCNKGKITAKMIKILGNYKYSFFLRFWTQTFLELMVFGLVQLRSTVKMPVQGYLNEGFATLFVVIFIKVAAILTPPLVFVSSYVSRSEINEASDEFLQKWGSLFLEFKNDRGFWSSLYYFLYFCRRVAFVLSQVYLNSLLKLQGGLNIFFSVVCLGYLIYFKPFKEGIILISDLISEISILIAMSLSYCYLWELKDDDSQIIEIVIIFSVLAGMALQFIISFLVFAQSMLVIYRKIEKARSMQFVKNAENIFSGNMMNNSVNL